MTNVTFEKCALAAAILVAVVGCDGDRAPTASTTETTLRAGEASRANADLEKNSPMLANTVPHVVETAARSVPQLNVPRTKRRLSPQAPFDAAFWQPAASTHTLLDASGLGAVPVSEARFLWDDHALYVSFYAGDLDLQIRATEHDGPVWNGDAVTLSFELPDQKKAMITVSATGVVADGICPEDARDLGDSRCDLRWESGVKVGGDYDGTVNHLGDFDEEWTVQAAIPLQRLAVAPKAGSRVSFTVKRCEVAHDGVRSCGFWGDARTPAEMVFVD